MDALSMIPLCRMDGSLPDRIEQNLQSGLITHKEEKEGRNT